jgi:hypothetical protein
MNIVFYTLLFVSMIYKQVDYRHLVIGGTRPTLLFVAIIFTQTECRHLVIGGYPSYTVI